MLALLIGQLSPDGTTEAEPARLDIGVHGIDEVHGLLPTPEDAPPAAEDGLEDAPPAGLELGVTVTTHAPLVVAGTEAAPGLQDETRLLEMIRKLATESEEGEEESKAEVLESMMLGTAEDWDESMIDTVTTLVATTLDECERVPLHERRELDLE
jgi:hypothetical protein